jgi:sugar phosphate isomerase/epimerase
MTTMTRALTCLACVLAIARSAAGADGSAAARPAIYVDHAGLLKLGWQLACVGATFRDRSTFDMIDLLHGLNIHHIELSAEQIPAWDDPAAADALIAKLKSRHMDIVSFGPIDLAKTEAEARKVFDLGKRLKIKTILADPPDDSLDTLDKLANEYRINIAMVNSAGRGDDPDRLLRRIAGRSNRIGILADPVAWRQSGLSPVDCAQKLASHILEVRLSEFDDRDGAEVLGELKKQGFKGICAVECVGKTGDDLIDGFTRTVNGLSEIVAELSGAR